MRSLLSILAGVVVVSGIVSANLWRELRAERQLNADLRAQLVEEGSVPRPPALPAQPTAALTPAPVATPARSEAAPGPAPAIALPVQIPARAQDITALNRNLLADPEYRNALLAQARLSLRNSYPGLIEELGLSARDADELFTLLAENQTNLTSERVIASTDPAIIAERARLQRENQARLNDSLVALLGNDRYAQFQDYQRTRGARSTVASLGNTLAQANQPLTAGQMRTLISAMAAEQQRQQGDTQAQAMARNLSSANNPQDQARLLEEQLNRQEESNRRMLETMAPHLDPRQLETLRAQFESQIALNRASARVRRERDRVAQGQQ